MFPRGAVGGRAPRCSGAKCLWFDPDVTAPGAGVITRVRTYGSSPGGTYRLRTLTLAPGRTTAAAHALSAESGTLGSTADRSSAPTPSRSRPAFDRRRRPLRDRGRDGARPRRPVRAWRDRAHAVRRGRGPRRPRLRRGHVGRRRAAVRPGRHRARHRQRRLRRQHAGRVPARLRRPTTGRAPPTSRSAVGSASRSCVFPGNPAPTPAIQLVNNGPVDAARTVVTMTPPGRREARQPPTSSTGACLVAVTVTCTVGTLREGGHGNARRQHDHERAGSVPDRHPRVE